MTSPKITARKYNGNDSHSWAVFVNGAVYVSGLSRREVPYYKGLALKAYTAKQQSLT